MLDINKDKQEISLGMKQTEVNPWELVAEKYPPGTVVEGKARNLASYGAFIEIEPGIDGLLHVSDLSWTKKLSHPNELLQKGEIVKCVVLEVDQQKQRVALGLKQMTEDPWLNAIPEHYQPGMIVQGKITKITNFGVFVELEDDLEGLLHISELADHKVENPQDVVQQNQDVEVKILRVDLDERKIGLSLKRAAWTADQEAAADRADRKTGELWSRFAEGLDSSEIRIPTDHGIAGAVFTDGRLLNIDDAYNHPLFNPAVDRRTGFRTRSILCMSIVNKAGERIGVTQVLNKRGGPFTAKDEARLRAFTA